MCLLSLSAFSIEWKSIFISGDDSIPNFDNGRKDLSDLLAPLGAYKENQVHLTSDTKEVTTEVELATADKFFAAFGKMKVDPKTDGCLIFMTSHGAKNAGFYLKQAGMLPPQTFGQIVQATCGDAPTVILVSACYSGQFITAGLEGDNRVILTAARADRSSFGCSADTKYTYWDECLLENVDGSSTWKELHENLKTCISKKEEVLTEFQPSFPQAYFGKNVTELPILNK